MERGLFDLSDMHHVVEWFGKHAKWDEDVCLRLCVGVKTNPIYPICPLIHTGDLKNFSLPDIPREVYAFWHCRLQGTVCSPCNEDSLSLDGRISTKTRLFVESTMKRVYDELCRVWKETYPNTVCMINESREEFWFIVLKK